MGSVVYTSKSNYFIAISTGILQVGNDSFYAISSNTPIGQLLIGKTVGSIVKFREELFTIEKVL